MLIRTVIAVLVITLLSLPVQAMDEVFDFSGYYPGIVLKGKLELRKCIPKGRCSSEYYYIPPAGGDAIKLTGNLSGLNFVLASECENRELNTESYNALRGLILATQGPGSASTFRKDFYEIRARYERRLSEATNDVDRKMYKYELMRMDAIEPYLKDPAVVISGNNWRIEAAVDTPLGLEIWTIKGTVRPARIDSLCREAVSIDLWLGPEEGQEPSDSPDIAPADQQ